MGNTLNLVKRNPGKTIFGGTVVSGVIAGGIWLASLSSTGVEMKNDPFPAFLPVVIDVSASGSTSATAKYDAFCVRSPLFAQGNGSGTIVRATYHNVRNPNAASMDIGFVEDCADKSASGDTLLANTSTATGATNHYTTGTLAWQGAGSGRYLKGTFSKDPTGWSAGADTGLGFDGKLTVWLEDILGE